MCDPERSCKITNTKKQHRMHLVLHNLVRRKVFPSGSYKILSRFFTWDIIGVGVLYMYVICGDGASSLAGPAMRTTICDMYGCIE